MLSQFLSLSKNRGAVVQAIGVCEPASDWFIIVKWPRCLPAALEDRRALVSQFVKIQYRR